MKKQLQNSKTVAKVILGIMVLFAVGSICGMTLSINQIKDGMVARTPEAILASAGVKSGDNINLAVSYFDQKQDECVNPYDGDPAALRTRQFEWTSCSGFGGQKIEQGLADFFLSEDFLPVAQGGSLTTNQGVTDFSRWFSSVDGKSQEYTGAINLNYRVNFGVAEFYYENENFYPLDTATFSANDSANQKDGHNHLFTMSFAAPFTVMANGRENFEITADDDTFVFVGDRLALDMGGVHSATTGRFNITTDGEVYTGVGEEKDLAYSGIRVADNSIIRVFHADRDSLDSEFSIKFSDMNLNIAKSQLADSDEIQIAYSQDPNDPTYVAPLGESQTSLPDGTRGFVIVATVLGMVIVVASVLATMTLKIIIRKN